MPPKHPLGRAIDYVLKRWNKLSVYIDHGEIEIDTNWIENLIRPFAVGRKAWLLRAVPVELKWVPFYIVCC